MIDAASKRGFGETLDKPVEPPAPEVKAEEAAAAAAATEEPAAAASATTEEEPSYNLEEDGFIGARDLAAKLDADPALKAALPAELRNEIMANARLAEVGSAYRELFSSPEEAKVISETAQEHAGFIEAFNLLGTDPIKGADTVIQKLIEAGAKRDADGNIMRDAKGQPMTNGIAGRFFDQIWQRALANKVLKKVEALGDENVTAALDLVMESVGLRASTAAKDQIQDPALAARKADLDAQAAEIARQRGAAEKEKQTQHDEGLTSDLASLYEGEVGKMLGLATGLDNFTRQTVEQRIEQAVRKAIKTNTAYQMRKDRLLAMPFGPQRRAKEVTLAKEFFRDNLVNIARPILQEAGALVGGKLSERTAAQAARAETARSEVNGGRAAQSGSAGTPQSPAQQRAQAVEAYKSANGREPSDSELNVAMMLAAAKSRGFAA